MSTSFLAAGDLVHVTRAASVQFVRPIMFRVIRVLDWVTFDGWIWLDGYQLDERGDALVRRTIFVQPARLRVLQRTPAPRNSARPLSPPPVRRNREPARTPPVAPQRRT